MIGQRDYSQDSILTGDGCTFPYLNWSIFGIDNSGIDLCGDGTEDNIPEWFIPTWDNVKIIFQIGA